MLLGAPRCQETLKFRAVILLSDGNQTIGNSYLYQSKFLSQAVFPVVIGDTTPYLDLKIQQLNVNKYTFLGNTFPVEIFVSYNGSRIIQSNLKIFSGASLLFDKPLQLSPESNSMSTIAYLKALYLEIHGTYLLMAGLAKKVFIKLK